MALRFMDNRGYNRVRVLSPAAGETRPEVLVELKQGRVPEGVGAAREEIFNYLDGKIASSQPDREAYKAALLAWCNSLGASMPYLFSPVDDWAALLLPGDLLSSESIIADFQNNLSVEDCADVEVIGWLYQFYISEKKDQVFQDLRKNKKIGPENIPAGTQLFTPHWIVRFMTENSPGRLWLNNRPSSKLRSSMDYYIDDEKEDIFLPISRPEEIKMMDPACGSGHVLVYAFDLLYKIYEEEGYSPGEIPGIILFNNLFGIDIDDRAASLAAFALAMKARDKDRFFFRKKIIPQIIASQEIDLDLDGGGIRLSFDLQESFSYLKEAKNLGSLIPLRGETEDEIRIIKKRFSQKGGEEAEHLFQEEAARSLYNGLDQLDFLIPRYHCVVTNPPYMGGKGMNEGLKSFVGKYYPDSKSDLFAVFMERGLELLFRHGNLGMINQQSWMFLSSYEKLRKKLLKRDLIITMAHLGPRAFETIGGEVVQTTSFVLKKDGMIP